MATSSDNESPLRKSYTEAAQNFFQQEPLPKIICPYCYATQETQTAKEHVENCGKKFRQCFSVTSGTTTQQTTVGSSSSSSREIIDIDQEIMNEPFEVKCPLTYCIMTKPVKNTNCGHSYEEQSILYYITAVESPAPSSSFGFSFSSKPKAATCPVAGCRAPVSASSLQPNTMLKAYIEGFAKDTLNEEDEELE